MLDEPRPYRTAFLVVLAFVAAGLGAEYALAGRAGVEKLATALAMPVGIVWLFLVTSTIAAFVDRRPGLGALLALNATLLTSCGNNLISGEAVRSLEQPYVSTARSQPEIKGDSDAEKSVYGAVVILGGGASETPAGGAEVNGSGDRIVTAAKLFHAGKARNFVCAGNSAIESDKPRPSEAELAQQLLIDLGVPAETISEIGGANTSEELREVATAVEDGTISQPVGLITSAWHMGRVERLAKTVGLEIVPISSDFKSPGPSTNPVSVLSIVPNAEALQVTTLAAKERLAGFVRR